MRHLDASSFFYVVFGLIFGGIGGGLGFSLFVIGIAVGPLMISLIGGVFLLIFGGIGGGVGWLGWSRLQRVVEVFRRGEVVAGRIERVDLDRSVRQQGRSPVVLHYSFVWRGETIDGSTTSWKTSLLRAPTGAPVAVLVDPADPGRNIAWLPQR